MSLRAKLILSHSLPVLLLVPLLGFYLLSSLRGLYFDRLRDDLSRTGLILADVLQVDPELANNPLRLQELLQRADAQTPARIQIISQDGAVLAATELQDTRLIGTVSRDSTAQTVLLSRSPQDPITNSEGDGVTVTVPVVDSSRIGGIRLALQYSDIEDSFNRLTVLLSAGIVLILVLALGIGYTLGLTLSRSLRQLAREAKAIAQGDLTRRANVIRGDEVGELAASFNQMAAQLVEQRVTRERFLRDLAHEFRRPISALQAAAEVLEDGAFAQPDRAKRLLSGLQCEMGRLGRLTNRLTFAAQDGRTPVTVKGGRTNVASVLARVVMLFEPEAERRGIKLSLDASDILPFIQANEDALVEVFTNLIDNALKFTPTGGEVRVSAGTAEDQVWIQVLDTGMGLTADEQARLFKRFYRGDPARSRPRGIGLGLAIARELVQAANGTIRVLSCPDRGAAFRVELPQ